MRPKGSKLSESHKEHLRESAVEYQERIAVAKKLDAIFKAAIAKSGTRPTIIVKFFNPDTGRMEEWEEEI
jgi:hypothetical protein